MNPSHRPTDQHGFPMPVKFDDLPAPPTEQAPRRRATLVGRVVLVVLLLGVLAALAAESSFADKARDMWVQFLLRRAVERHESADLRGALADLDSAIAWLPPDTPESTVADLYRYRAEWHLENRQIDLALDDASRAVELQPNASGPYLTRSRVLHWRGEHLKAVDDLNKAVRFRTKRDIEALNARAYGRALAGVELDEALVDIEEALTAWPDNADFLDTRGYIHFLRGDAEQALVDLDRALEIAVQQRIIILDRFARGGASLKQVERLKRQWNEKLSVLYHHRGEIHEKLHQLDDAASDLNQAEKLGYNPADGVF